MKDICIQRRIYSNRDVLIVIILNYEAYFKYLKGRDHSEDLGVDGRILLEGVLEKGCGKGWS
jgi:hypothetical protein